MESVFESTQSNQSVQALYNAWYYSKIGPATIGDYKENRRLGVMTIGTFKKVLEKGCGFLDHEQSSSHYATCNLDF